MLWSWLVDHRAGVIHALATDIAELRGADAAEARYRLLAEHSADAMTVSDRNSRYTYLSPGSPRIFGWGIPQMLGRQVCAFLHPDDRDEFRAELDGMLTSPDVVTAAARFRHPDTRYRWLETTWHPIVDPHSDEVTGVFGSTREITERRGAQAVLLRQGTNRLPDRPGQPGPPHGADAR